jgi:hypothetical protein
VNVKVIERVFLKVKLKHVTMTLRRI